MEFQASVFPGTFMSRRQFGLAVGGGAFLLVAGGVYGVIARSDPRGMTSVGTDFGRISILRAGRFARLDPQGHSATTNLMTAAPHLGSWGVESQRGVSANRVWTADGGHGHGGPLQDPAWPQPVNLTFGDVLVLEAEVHNTGPEPVLFSPAQLRLKLADSGTTVTHRDCDRSPGILPAQAKERILVSYLAPHALMDLELEFSDFSQEKHRRLALPQVTVLEAIS